MNQDLDRNFSASSEQALGRLIDERFTLKRLLGSGGMASVYEASQFGLTRPVAIKLMHVSLQTDPQFRLRFLRECRLLASVSHPFVITFLHFGIDKGEPYLVMEFCDAPTLRSFMEEQVPSPEQENRHARERKYIQLTKSIAQGLVALHEKGIVHRDLTPQNILITDLANSHVKIIDFGLARLTDTGLQRLTQSGALVGSLQYMSPEQCVGRRPTTSSDVYSLGCILFEMIDGSSLFDAESPVGLLQKHQAELPRAFQSPLATPYLDNLCRACLEKDPLKRPEAVQLVEMLEMLETGRFNAVKHRLKASSMHTTHARARRLQLANLILVLAVALIVVASMYANKLRGKSNEITRSSPVESMLDLSDLLASLDKQPRGDYQDVLQQWRSTHKRARLDVATLAALAAKYHRQRPDLCLIVCQVGLDALAFPAWNQAAFETFLHLKLQSMAQLGTAPSLIKQAMYGEHQKWYQNKNCARALRQTDIELALLQDDDISSAATEYFHSFAFDDSPSNRCMVDSVSIMLKKYSAKNKSDEFRRLALATSSWIRAGSRSRPDEVQNLCSTIARLTNETAPDIAIVYWSLLSPALQKNLCTMAPYDQVLSEIFFRCHMYDELQQQLVTLATFYESENKLDMALESYRMAIHYAVVESKTSHHNKRYSQQFLERVDRLFKQVIDDQPEFWLFRAMATVQEEQELGYRREALELLRLITPERVSRLSRDKQTELNELLSSHKQSLKS